MASKDTRADSAPTHPIVPDFPADAFAGTADYYARYRPPYPQELIEDLCVRTGATGEGRLLDLACGTGQVALALAPHFREVGALDREPEMVEVGRREAAAHGVGNIAWKVGRAEDLEAPAGAFELITVGNAFHRLHRRLVGQKAMTWLAPGRCLAVLGSSSLWTGKEDWQALARDVARRWRVAQPVLQSGKSDQPRETFEEALRFVGFDEIEAHTFPVPHVWSLDSLIGNLYSMSGLSKRVLGDKAESFERELRQALLAHNAEGRYPETMSFYLFLARKPLSLPRA